jgi:hypothetical protein
MSIKPFEDFELYCPVDSMTIDKYTNILPHALIRIWKDYGFGSFAKGFLRTINPDEYQELINVTYAKDPSPIPVFTTGLGDIIVWDEGLYKNEKYYYFGILYYRHGRESMLITAQTLDDDDFFTDSLTDSDSYKNEFFWSQYMEALKINGKKPDYDECYGYVPLLGLGGAEKSKNLQIVKVKEHIMLINEMLGPIQQG